MLKSWSWVFPLRIFPFDSTHQELQCPGLICGLIPHLATPRYHAILVVLLRPLVGVEVFQGDVVCEDLGLVHPQVILPCLEATRYNTQLFFASQPSQLCSIRILNLEKN